MATRIENTFRIGAALVLTLFIAIGTMVYQSTKSMIDVNLDVAHTQEILIQLSTLQSTLTNNHVNIRTYVTSGAEENLAGVEDAKTRITASLNRVHSLITTNHSEQHTSLEQLDLMVASLFRLWEEAVTTRRKDGAPAADQFMTLHVVPVMGVARRIFGEMIQRESQLLAVESRQAEMNARRAIAIELLLGVAVVGLLVATYLFIRSEARKRVKAFDLQQESEERLRLLLDSTAEAMYGIDVYGNCTFCNPAALALLGYRNANELVGQNLHELTHHTRADGSPYPVAECRGYKAMRDGHGTHVDDEVLWRADGTKFPAEYWSYPIRRGDKIVGAVITFLDISERKRAEQNLNKAHNELNAALRESQARARENMELSTLGDLFQSCQTIEEACTVSAGALPRIFASRPGALCITSSSRTAVETIAVWNGCSSSEQVFGPEDCWALRRGKAHGMSNASSALRCAHLSPSMTGDYLCVPLAAQGETLGVLYIEDRIMDPDGATESPEASRANLQRLAAAAGERISLALANLKLRAILRDQSIRDSLTGLFNRRYMEESLVRELHRAARKNRNLALVMMDVDRFKNFNDTFGHPAGDMLLREIADILKSQVRAGDTTCRYGGEEFAIIFSETDADGACICMEKIREEIKALQLHYRGQALGSITVSAGVAVYPGQGDNAEELVRAADTALYRAKSEGRNRVVVGSPLLA
jgi:diguanylate cyclase (GGDEF)-like protein/PAS domain S-box-containing protein